MSQVIEKRYNEANGFSQKFGLWISMGSLLMMFMAFTSAYIVRHGAGNWLEFAIPDIFLISTFVIVLSSFALQGSYYYFNQGSAILYKGLLTLAFLLGISFLVLQNAGWNELFELGIDLKINPSASFYYLITWVHAAHIIAGLTTLVVALIHAFTLKYEITDIRKNRFLLVLQFWHFLGFLWIYLYAFLLLTR